MFANRLIVLFSQFPTHNVTSKHPVVRASKDIFSYINFKQNRKPVLVLNCDELFNTCVNSGLQTKKNKTILFPTASNLSTIKKDIDVINRINYITLNRYLPFFIRVTDNTANEYEGPNVYNVDLNNKAKLSFLKSFFKHL
jgi:hypothetical protein